jgi:hypothetical protein
MTAPSAPKVTSADDSFRHIFDYYKIPLLVVVIGVIISLSGFVLTFFSQTDDLKKDFILSAARDTAVIDARFLLFQGKVRGAAALFEAFGGTDQETVQSFIPGLLSRGPFEALLWQPVNKAKGSFNLAPGSSRQPSDFDEISEVKELIGDSIEVKGYKMSSAFALPEEQGSYVALMIPVLQEGTKTGSIIFILNQKQIYEEGPNRILQPEQASIYIFDSLNDSSTSYKIEKSNPFLSCL